MFNKKINQLRSSQNQILERIIELEEWRNKYVTCESCGLLVKKSAATPEAVLSDVIKCRTDYDGYVQLGNDVYVRLCGEPNAKVVYYCQHCKPKKNTKK